MPPEAQRGPPPSASREQFCGQFALNSRAADAIKALQFIISGPGMPIQQHRKDVARFDTLLNQLALCRALTHKVLLGLAHFKS